MFTLTIETDNAAFEGDAATPIERILRDLILREGRDQTILDVNGNFVGTAVWS